MVSTPGNIKVTSKGLAPSTLTLTADERAVVLAMRAILDSGRPGMMVVQVKPPRTLGESGAVLINHCTGTEYHTHKSAT